jgi:hypothetical protein
MADLDLVQILLRMEARQVRIEKKLDLLLKALAEEVAQVSSTTLSGDMMGAERDPNQPL